MSEEFQPLANLLAPQKPLRGGWIVRITGKGMDKSDLQVIHINETPDFSGDKVTYYKSKNTTSFARNGAKIFRYRSEARNEKKRIGWKTNQNRWEDEHDNPGW